MKKSLSALAASFLGISVLSGCGATQFDSAKGKASVKLTGDAVTSGDAEPALDASPAQGRPDKVTWTYRCNLEDSKDRLPISREIDKATTYLGGKADLPYQIELVGEQCEGKGMSHDVVFLLDSSLSMALHDPMIGGTCARLETLKSTIARYTREGNSRFSLVTFSRADQRLLVTSNGFYPSYDELAKGVSDIEGGDDFAELVCNDYHIGTDFGAGFSEAANLVTRHADPNAKLDLFFVSDGQPTCGHSGLQAVEALKAKGATIAAISVPHHSNLMQSSIASKDAKGVPYYAEYSKLSELVERVIGVTGSMMPTQYFSYRATGTTQWTRIDLEASKPGVLFVLPEFEINQITHPDGLEVQYTIVGAGQGGKDRVLHGQIVWDDVADAVSSIPQPLPNPGPKSPCDDNCTVTEVIPQPLPADVTHLPTEVPQATPPPSNSNSLASGWSKVN